jgi:hypothetical protein
MRVIMRLAAGISVALLGSACSNQALLPVAPTQTPPPPIPIAGQVLQRSVHGGGRHI